jgi:hypothetical protein
MKLLNKELEAKFKTVGSQENIKDPIIIAKYFHPYHSVNWYATEYDPENKMFFGFVAGLMGDPSCDEWGSFTLDEIESINLKGLPVERDLHFGYPKASTVKAIKLY